MHRSRLGNIVVDCQTDDLLSEARFWSAALRLEVWVQRSCPAMMDGW